MCNFKQEIISSYFTTESPLRYIFEQQITNLILINNDKDHTLQKSSKDYIILELDEKTNEVNTMNKETRLIESSTSRRQDSVYPLQDRRFISYGTSKNIRLDNKLDRDLTFRDKLKSNALLSIYAFAVFTSIAITASALIICLTSKKGTNQTCQFNFEQSAKQLNKYDSLPHDIGIGDFNEDGYRDIVVANSGTDNIGIFFNDQNGTFASQITFSTGIGSLPHSVAVGDINNDTHLDIVVANYGSNSIGAFLGYGNGNFTEALVTSLGSSRPLSLVIGYLNNDHILDVAVVNYGTATTAVLFGANNGSFEINNIYNMGFDSIPYALVLADFDRDNTMDIVAVNYGTSELVILFNNGMGYFTMDKYWTGPGYYPSSVTTGDFNNDTRLDIAIAYSGNSSIGIFLGNQNRSFTNLMTFPLDAGSLPQSIGVGDFNNDTKLDIVVLDSKNNNALILKGDGNGSFSIITRHSTGYNSDSSSLVVDDFNNDHKLDLAITNNGTNNVLILTSYLTYIAPDPRTYTTENNSIPQSLDVADFNQDNYLDIVVADKGDTNAVGVFLNLGNETFTSQQTYNMSESSEPVFVITGDVNNDHHVDIIVALNNNNSLGILLGYGNGSFVYSNTLLTGDNSNPSVVAVGDLDNDGNLDIIAVNNAPISLGLFFGFGNGNFTDMTPFFDDSTFDANYVELGDVNDDKILDIIASNDRGVGNIAIFLGYGNRSFHDRMFISTDEDIPSTFTIGDLNNDHQLDIVYTSSTTDYIGVLLGNGNGTFETVTKYVSACGCYPISVALGYYNDDAFVDIAVSNNHHTSVDIYLGTGNGSFEKPIPLSTVPGSYPYFVMFGDFNNDHQQDIVVTNDGTDNIEIFFVYYKTDFLNETFYTTGSSSHPVSVGVGDLNNNGQSDVVAANSGNDDIGVFLHYNNGIFINTTTYSTGLGSHPQSVTIADFNRDHLLDIAVVDYWDNNMNVFLGLGDGSFDTRRVYSTGSASAPNSIVAGDLNNDSRMDVVIANEGTNNVAVFLAFNYISFTNYLTDVPGTDPNPYYIVTGDFNNDHLLDMAVANRGTDNIGIYLGYGNGTFSDQITCSTEPSTSPQSLAVGDFNGDNYLDIVVANFGTNDIGVFLGYGNGSFQSQILLPSISTEDLDEPFSVATGDFDNDGNLDIVVANFYSNNVWVFWGYGNGSFTGQIIYSMDNSSNPVWIAVGNLNNDTILDIIFANRGDNNICILFGYGNGSFGNVIMLSTGTNSQPGSVALGDFNQDKSMDIAVANQHSNNIVLFFGNGNGNFSSPKYYSVSSTAFLHSITVSDINNDTFLDILVADYNELNSSFAIFYGFGDGNFTLPKIYSLGLNAQPFTCTIATGDFNNDGKLDLAINYDYQNSIGVFIQNGSEPFGSSALFYTGNQSQPKSVAVGDFNNDNHLDIAVANSASNSFGILLGYGNGEFANQLTCSTGNNSSPSSITVGHFNNDHYLDIAVVNTASNNIGVFLGYGNGRFTNMTIYSNNIIYNPIGIAANDMNKDGYLDLIVANSGSNDILVFLGQGNGSFLEPKAFSVGYNSRPQSVAIGDINNDNKLDIVVANYGTDYIEILLQTC